MERTRIWRWGRRRTLGVGLSAAMIAAPLALISSQAAPTAAAGKPTPPNNATVRIGGPQHFCGTNGITCAEPAAVWDEYAGYDKAVKKGAHIRPYIGHDEPAVLFYSHQRGAGYNNTYQLKLPTDPPTRPKQDG